MQSESIAYSEALRLQRILSKAIEESNSDVINFLKEHIYPIYREQKAESFSSFDDDLITSTYGG